jgi:hypothetical protein
MAVRRWTGFLIALVAGWCAACAAAPAAQAVVPAGPALDTHRTWRVHRDRQSRSSRYYRMVPSSAIGVLTDQTHFGSGVTISCHLEAGGYARAYES